MNKEFAAYCNMFNETNKNKEKTSFLSEIDAYKKILNNDVINEGEAETIDEPPAEEVKPETETVSEDIDMKFSPELASEFINTINEFTTVCAKIVKVKNVGKELSDTFYDLYAKIKNLADAASKTK